MNTPVDLYFKKYIADFLQGNRAGKILSDSLRDCGVGLMPLVDHCTIRTKHVDERAQEILNFGYTYDTNIGVLEFGSWWAKVYRKPGYPSMFIDQAYDDVRGQQSLIPAWVDAHGDQCFHHIAILVEDIEFAIQSLKKKGIEFSGEIVGDAGSELRQIFSSPELKEGQVFTVLELIERHNGYAGFLPPQADGLMESTRGFQKP